MPLGEVPITSFFSRKSPQKKRKISRNGAAIVRHKAEEMDEITIMEPSPSKSSQRRLEEHFPVLNPKPRPQKTESGRSIPEQRASTEITPRRLRSQANPYSSTPSTSSTFQAPRKRGIACPSPPTAPTLIQKSRELETSAEVQGTFIPSSQTQFLPDLRIDDITISMPPSSNAYSSSSETIDKRRSWDSNIDYDEATVVPSSQSQPPLLLVETTPSVTRERQSTGYKSSASNEFVPSSQSQEIDLFIYDESEHKPLSNLTKSIYSPSTHYGSTPNISANPVVRTFSDELFQVSIQNSLLSDIFEECNPDEESSLLQTSIPHQNEMNDGQSVTESESDEEWHLRSTLSRKTTANWSPRKVSSRTGIVTPTEDSQGGDDETSPTSSTPDPISQPSAVQEFQNMFTNADDDSSYPPDFPMSLRY